MAYQFSVPGIAGGNLAIQNSINNMGNIPLLQAPQKTGLLGLNQRLEGLATNPLFNMGIGMLGSQSPHFGGSLADGGRQLQQGVMLKERMKDQSANREYRNKMLDLAKQRANPQNQASTNAIRNAQFLYPNDPVKQRQYMEQAMQGATPASIQEWQTYQSLSPEQQEQYLTMKRANRPFLDDVNNVPTIVQPSATGLGTPQQTPLSTQGTENAAAEAAAAAKARGTGIGQGQADNVNNPPTPGQLALDNAFAKEYATFQAGGGYADAVKQIAQLKGVLGTLDRENITGPIIGATPDFILNKTNPEAVASREAVEEVVQRNLRLILGAQFTEAEGTRLISRAFNPNLSEAENKKRLSGLITQMEKALEAKQSATQYFEQNGTLRGWQGKQYTISDFEHATSGDYDAKSMKSKYGLE